MRHRELFSLLGLGAFYAVMIAATWQRWTSPVIDHGREMNLPARLLTGEQLYVDVHYLYGPLAPHLNALLYRLFGIHLAVLHAGGIVCGALVLLLVYIVARQLLRPPQALLAAATVLVVCAVKSTANYVMPYSFGALYALVAALGALVCAIFYLRRENRWWMFGAGLCAGAVLTSKLELTLPALAAALTAWAVQSRRRHKILWADLVALALPFVFVNIVAYGAVLARVPLGVLLEDNRLLFTNMPPQLYYFNQRVSGIASWPRGTAAMLAGAGLWLAVCAACALAGWFASRRESAQPNDTSNENARRPVIALAAGLGVWALLVAAFRLRADASPLTAGTLVLTIVVLMTGRRVLRLAGRAPHTEQSGGADVEAQGVSDSLLFVVAVFALASVARVFLNVTVSSTYSPFFLPVLIVVYCVVLFEVAPRLLLTSHGARAHAARAAAVLLSVAVVAVAVGTTRRLHRKYTYRISVARGTLYTTPEIGAPFDAALRWLLIETRPDDRVLIVPQGTSLNFLAARRSPFAEEIILPGFLEGEREAEAIRRLDAAHVPWVVVERFPSEEFREAVFGRDYNRALMRWIEERYAPAAKFGPTESDDERSGFGITIYKLERH